MWGGRTYSPVYQKQLINEPKDLCLIIFGSLEYYTMHCHWVVGCFSFIIFFVMMLELADLASNAPKSLAFYSYRPAVTTESSLI